MLSIRNKKVRGAPDAGQRAPAGKDKRAPAGKDKRTLAGNRARPAAQPSAAAQPAASAEGTPSADVDPLADADPSGNGQPRPSSAADGPSPGSRRALKNWRVRSRLLLLIGIPTVTAVMLGGIRIDSSAQSALAYQRVVRLANLNGEIIGLVQALQRERQDTITFITLGENGGRASLLSSNSGPATDPALAANARLELKVLSHGDYAVSSRSARHVTSLLSTIGAGYSELTQQDARAAAAAIRGLGPLRTAAARSRLPALVVIQEYTNKINTLLALDNQVAEGSSDSTLADGVRVVGLVSAMKEEASEQQALITAAHPSSLIGLSRTGFTPGIQAAITDAEAQQQANEAAFNSAATASQRQQFNGALSAPTVAGAQAQVQQAISLARTASAGAEDPVIANAESSLYDVVSGMRSVETQLVKSVIARSTMLRNSAITGVIISSTAVVLVLALALVFITIVGRSMVRPLRKLRAGALEVAGIRLPETVRRMSETDGDDAPLDVEPIGVDSTDEIGQVARAFDQVHREALRLAANEAALRGNVNAMFVNLSRRSQSLVERQIQLIDDLELGEQDAERLASLFQMDHLATRMRRNSENLLVLAGHDVSRRWNQPVALVDVLRAAVSEIEQYERVTLNVQPGIAVRGQAVNDVVHLLSELAENATSFSSAETPVTVAGHLLSSGGVLLDITDRGVGMGAEEMAHANWRLDNPPVVDVAVSRRMGLFVVARLAARHGIRVRLRPAASGGLTALVWLPDEAVTHEAEGGAPGLRRSDLSTLDAAAESAGQAGFSATGFATAGPAPAGSVAGVFSTGEWGSGERTAAEEAVTAARTPKFAPLRVDADAGDDGSLRSRRVPGAGPRPGAATGPLAAFRTSPQPAADTDSAPFGAIAPSPAGTVPAAGPSQDSAFGNGADTFGANSDVFGGSPGMFTPGLAPSGSPGPDSGGSPGTDAFSTSPEPAATDADPFAASGEGFGTAPQPALGATGPQPVLSGTDPQPVLGAPTAVGQAADRAAQAGGLASSGWTPGSSAQGGVVVPPVMSAGRENRLPIFESVESDWFRRGRHAVAAPGQEEEEKAASWSSPADEGWRAAEVVSAPSSGGLTSAGLPKRVPKANLVPGTAGLEPAAAPSPARSAAATRDRFASFQRGIREGRAARRGPEESQEREDDGGT